MLSVQSPSYAGMERLGVPVRTSIGSSTDERSHISRRIRVDSLQSDDLLTDHHTIGTQSSHHLYHHVNSDVIRCPHHVALPDSERGSDRDLHNRTSFQQTELTRPYIKAPPNKTALDVPELSYNLFPHSSSCNLNNQQRITTTAKSKPNPIAKFFLRISSKATETTSCGPSSTTTTPSTNIANHHHHHHPTHTLNHIKNNSSSSSLSIYKSVSSDISTNQSIPSSKLYTTVPTSSTQSLTATIEPSPPDSDHVCNIIGYNCSGNNNANQNQDQDDNKIMDNGDRDKTDTENIFC